MKKEVCIVIPIYKQHPTESDKLSIETTIKKLERFDLYFVTFPELDMDEYKSYSQIRVRYFPKKYFESVKDYNKLMLSPLFYLKFTKYKYICMVQTDAVVLGNADQLEKFVKMDYDYIGAPWIKPLKIYHFEPRDHYKILNRIRSLKRILMGEGIFCYVGNGGASLRKVKSSIKVLLRYRIFAYTWQRNEDLFFAYYGSTTKIFRTAPIDIAGEFSLEATARADIAKGIRPFVMHAWEKYCPEIFQLIALPQHTETKEL